MVPDSPRIHFKFREPAEKLNIREFHCQDWRVPGLPSEPIYTEDGCSFDTEILTHPDRPSLFREREIRKRYEDLRMSLRRVIEDQRSVTSVFAEAISARDTVDRIEAIVRHHE